MPLDESFDQIRESIFRVEAKWAAGSASATAFAIAMFRDSGRLVLATAAHVLDYPDNEAIDWDVKQFDEHGGVARHIGFATQRGVVGGAPFHIHKHLDIGVLVLPATSASGQPFARPDEQPVRVIDILSGVATGARIGWAGFPGSVESFLEAPQLCYFEGVVSAMVDNGKRPIYIVDGHTTHGVSGGPVWYWSDEKNRLEVFGIATAYGNTPGSMLPGFCVVEPINPVMYFLESAPWDFNRWGDHLVTNRRG